MRYHPDLFPSHLLQPLHSPARDTRKLSEKGGIGGFKVDKWGYPKQLCRRGRGEQKVSSIEGKDREAEIDEYPELETTEQQTKLGNLEARRVWWGWACCSGNTFMDFVAIPLGLPITSKDVHIV
jgi:hypothetical protein